MLYDKINLSKFVMREEYSTMRGVGVRICSPIKHGDTHVEIFDNKGNLLEIRKIK